ncbi:MAG: Endoplasmic reticulum zinc transporter [Thelocarpon superellum]|nr:MAG: Endoplasmic reticulum zinc transporter [Thelocarpon superellum]
MASNLPIPVPPRTPTPPAEDQALAGLGLQDLPINSPSKVTFDPSALSPMRENFPTQYVYPPPQMGRSPGSALSAAWSGSSWPSSTFSTASEAPGEGHGTGPFNFKPTTLSKSPVIRSSVGQRRGHKYKHSSVSHHIFLEPTPRAPLALPASLPMPTFKECRNSMSKEQRSRITWCVCHALVAGYTWWSAQGSLAMTALSHLILFDALGATVCVVVDVLGNFEVWKRSSIRHPFGLERAEVLAGFAMSVFLLFMGMDLISHNLQHILETMGHEAHHEHHHHQRVSPGSVDMASLVAIISTLVSALGLKNHARIGKAMRFAYIESLPSVLSNPSHFLTLSCSALLLLLPLLSVRMYLWLDRLLSSTIAISMCVLGVRLVKNLASMLLMSYAGAGTSTTPSTTLGNATTNSSLNSGSSNDASEAIPRIIHELESDPAISAVEDARFWQVHYGLCMANLKIRVRRENVDEIGTPMTGI